MCPIRQNGIDDIRTEEKGKVKKRSITNMKNLIIAAGCFVLFTAHSCKKNSVIRGDRTFEQFQDSCNYLEQFYTQDSCVKLLLFDSVSSTAYSSDCLGKMIRYFENSTGIKSLASYGFGGYYYSPEQELNRQTDLKNWKKALLCE